MEMVDAVITKTLFSDRKSRSVNIFFPDLGPLQTCAEARMLGNRFSADHLHYFNFHSINEAHKQYSLLDTICNYIVYLGPPGQYL